VNLDVTQRKLSDFSGAEAALVELCRPYAPAGFDPQCVVVQPDEIPHPQDQLLVHHAHMTEVLQKHHGQPVNVHVQDWRLDGDLYSRKIALTPAGSDKVVEWGIVQLDFRYMSQEVRDEIMARRKPLGAILIAHNVLRRIKPRWFLRFPESGPILRLFEPPTASEPGGFAYGRIGTIYCNEEPAIELLEVVLNASTRNV
jgi:hypothetical protein